MSHPFPTCFVDFGYCPPRVRLNEPESGWEPMEVCPGGHLMTWAISHPHGVWVTHGLVGFVKDYSSNERLYLERCFTRELAREEAP